MKLALVVFIILHGCIHALGFAKAFKLAHVIQLSQHITRFNGILWLVACLLFISSAIFFSINEEWWWIFSVSGVVMSQYLIINDWNDAKFGTVANIIILVVLVGSLVGAQAKN